MKSVDRGAALLDERLPGWRDEVDPNALDIGSCSTCVLGQLFGSYERGLRLLDVPRSGATFGFNVAGRASADAMTNAWKRELDEQD